MPNWLRLEPQALFGLVLTTALPMLLLTPKPLQINQAEDSNKRCGAVGHISTAHSIKAFALTK